MTTPSPKSSTAPATATSTARVPRTTRRPDDPFRPVPAPNWRSWRVPATTPRTEPASCWPPRLCTQPATAGSDDERTRQLVLAVRRDLLTELRSQEQEQARRQLTSAADSSEDAVTGVVQGVTTIVRSLVPAVLVRPEEVIETSTHGRPEPAGGATPGAGRHRERAQPRHDLTGRTARVAVGPTARRPSRHALVPEASPG